MYKLVGAGLRVARFVFKMRPAHNGCPVEPRRRRRRRGRRFSKRKIKVGHFLSISPRGGQDFKKARLLKKREAPWRQLYAEMCGWAIHPEV